MNRRKVLQYMLGGAGVTMGGSFIGDLVFQPAQAQTPNSPTLLVVFQRGGCDGLSFSVPYGDSHYPGLRTTTRIPGPNASDPTAAIALGDPNQLANQPMDFFGLHPALSPLLDIYNAGDMAILPTVHYDNPSRSHFTSTHFIEVGVPSNSVEDGWLNRFLVQAGSTNLLQAIGFGSSLDRSLMGAAPALAMSSMADYNFGFSSADTIAQQNMMRSVYYDTPNPATDLRQLVHGSGQQLLESMDRIEELASKNYTPANGANYPNPYFARVQLKNIAQLIKAKVGLKVATVSMGGWDTHNNQAARIASGFETLAGGLRAFYDDLGDEMNNVVVVVMTEFGRTCHENSSRGTDHGYAATWSVIGGGVRGGIHGVWPGLDPNNELEMGRFLAHTIDYRDVMGDVLSRISGGATLNYSSIFPNHSYTPLGLYNQFD